MGGRTLVEDDGTTLATPEVESNPGRTSRPITGGTRRFSVQRDPFILRHRGSPTSFGRGLGKPPYVMYTRDVGIWSEVRPVYRGDTGYRSRIVCTFTRDTSGEDGDGTLGLGVVAVTETSLGEKGRVTSVEENPARRLGEVPS